MRLVYATDLHLTTQCPTRRTEGPRYLDALLAKLAEVGDIAREENAQAVLFGGDMFHSKNIHPRVALGLRDVLSLFPNVPIYAAYGNHDVGYHGLDQAEETWAGVLAPTYLPLTYPGDGQIVPLSDTVNLVVLHYRKGLEVALTDGEMEWPYEPGKLHLCMAHANILNDPAPFEHALMGEIRLPYEITLVSHYHPAQGIRTNAFGRAFVAPGALARNALHAQEATWTPQAAVLDIHGDGQVSVTFRPLRCAEGFSEVFDTETVALQTKVTEDMAAFVSGLRVGGFSARDPKTLLSTMAAAEGVEPPVREKAVEALEEVLDR